MGCQKEEALSIIRFASVVGAHCVGISFNLGNDCVNPGIYKDAIQFCSNLIIAVRMICGIELSVMNIGGGFSTQNSGPYACFQEVSIKTSV
jgi:diaminopimelate decarboxylase